MASHRPHRKPSQPPRPTHFLAIPLHTNPAFRSRITAFQTQLLTPVKPQDAKVPLATSVRGLDSSTMNNPMRLHLTLGVMALSDTPVAPDNPFQTSPAHTVSSALSLLYSLKADIDAILNGHGKVSQDSDVMASTSHDGFHVVLDVLDIMRPVKPKASSANVTLDAPNSADDVWADILFLSPKETGPEGLKLRQVAELVNSTFKKEGYITETRPLKLHCTLTNTSQRRPRGQPFCYTDILCSDAIHMIGATPSAAGRRPRTAAMTGASASTATAPPTPSPDTSTKVKRANALTALYAPPPVPVDFAFGLDTKLPVNGDTSVHVTEIGLWKMGSHGPNGEYVSCGEVKFGKSGE